MKKNTPNTHTHAHTLTSEDLVEEDLDVVGGERLRRHDDFVQVALHQLCDHVAVGAFRC